MFILINTLFLALIYVILIAFMISKSNFNSRGNGDDDSDGGGDGGWDDSDGRPPLDLPPGVFILPPDEDDPSLSKRRMVEEDLLV